MNAPLVLSFSTHYICMWGWRSWHPYPASAFWKEEQSFSSALGMCWTISQTMSRSQQEGKGGCNARQSLRPRAEQAAQLGAGSSLAEANQDKETFPLHAGVSQNSSLHLPPRPLALNALSLIISTFLCVHTAMWAALALSWRWDVPVPRPWSKSRRGHFVLTLSFCKPVQLLCSPAKLPRTFSSPFLVLLLS